MDEYNAETSYMDNGTNHVEDAPLQAPGATQPKDTYRESFAKVTALLDSLSYEERGRILRTIKELYGDDIKKRKRTQSA